MMKDPQWKKQPDLVTRFFLGTLEWVTQRSKKRGKILSLADIRRTTDRPCFPKVLSSLGVRRVVDVRVPGATELRPARLFVPYGPVNGVVLFLHGGGFVHCGLNSHHGICCRLARQSGAAVLSFDYRLAPEHPFPAAVEDSWAALRWLQSEAWRWGGKVAVAGDSAGGNLSAVLAQRVRDRGAPDLTMQLLFYPALYGARDVASRGEMGDGYMLTLPLLQWYADQYVSSPDDLLSPDLAPIEAKRFDALAPAVIMTAEFDPLRDEGAGYADVLRKAGTPVFFHCWPGAIHGFLNFYSFMRVGREAIALGAAKLRQAFNQH